MNMIQRQSLNVKLNAPKKIHVSSLRTGINVLNYIFLT